MDIAAVFNFYRSEFLSAYSDVVGTVVKKPKQVQIELENTLAHIAQYFNPKLEANEREDNAKKAHSHLQRATLDCYKILWVYINGKLDEIYDDRLKRASLNTSEEDFLSEYNLFKNKAREARKIELENIGIDPLAALESYKEAMNIGKKIIKNFDQNKYHKLKKLKTTAKIKDIFIALVIGFVAGLVANYIFNEFL